ncbi:9626_t:CDS:2, partial [Acaulospora colombiana]
MAVHPEIQHKVQAELDSIVGQDAAWKESQRWITSVPMSVPHLNGQEDIYKGMRIPKGSKLLLNIKSVKSIFSLIATHQSCSAMLNDVEIFDSPEDYCPERWLEICNHRAKDLPDIHTVFGFASARVDTLPKGGFTFGMSVLAAYDVIPIDGASTPNRSDIVWEDSGI